MNAGSSRPRNHVRDLHGASRLALAATAGLTDLIEAMHGTIARGRAPLGRPDEQGTRGITGMVYAGIRGVTQLVAAGVDAALGRLAPMLGEQASTPGREAALAALNGVLGDYLEETGNPLAIAMSLRRDAASLPLERAALAAALPQATGRLLVLVHGLCMNDLRWYRRGHDHGEALARELGYTPVYLHYNSGRHVSANGREFAGLLQRLLREWPVPVERFVILGHSMGGLVGHSALHYGQQAGHAWLRQLDQLVFLGTPHNGSPLERGGHAVDVMLGVSPYSAPFARLGRIRSAGITDLRHGYLLDEEWRRASVPGARPKRRPVPLPAHVRCYAIAATLAGTVHSLHSRLVGDGLVSVPSALGRHRNPALDLGIPESRQFISRDTGHLGLLDSPAVFAKLREWLR